MQIISRKEAKELGLNRYFTGKPCKHGHISERYVNKSTCVKCMYLARDRWVVQNPDKSKASVRAYTERVKESKKKYHAQWYQENKTRKKEQNKRWREVNRDKERARGLNFTKRNPEYYSVRTFLLKVQNNWRGDRAKAEETLGYTYEQLRQHLELQFVDGMGWDNRSEWHIDHIKPISAFIKEGITDPAIVNALDNLQPLWAKDNLSKGAKWDG